MSFQVKTAEELAKMDAPALADYMFAKLTHDNEQLKAMIAKKADPEEVARVRDEIIETHNKTLEQVNTILSAVKEQGLALSRMGQKATDDKPETVRTLLEKNRDQLKAFRAGSRNEWLSMSFKDAIMTNAANITGEIPQALRIPGFNELPLRPNLLLNTLRQAATDRTVISWVYRANRAGEPAPTAENALKPLINFDFIVGSEAISKYTGRTVVTMEMVDDIEFMQDAIRSDLLTRLLLDIENDAYAGSGAAGPPKILSGVRTLATAFSAPSLMAGAIDSANDLDVLNAAFTQINLAFQPAPTHIFMNPQTVSLMRAYKVSTSDRRYVGELYETAAGLSFMGAVIVPTPLVTAGDFLVGYMPYAALYNRMAPEIKLGLGTGDFENNRMTLLAEWRGAVVIKTNDRTAFVRGDFATAKAALETT